MVSFQFFACQEVLASLLGGILAMVCSEPKPSRIRHRVSACSLWQMTILISMGCGLSVHAAKESVVNSKMFSVNLQRQQIPLQNQGGVIYYKSAYFGEISVGAPYKQRFNVVFDTGSGHLVLPSTLCRLPTCMSHRRYQRRLSARARDIDADGTVVARGQPRDQIAVSFGTGEITGIFVSDEVCLDSPAPSPVLESESSDQGNTMLQVGKHVLTKKNASDAPEVEPETRKSGCFDMRMVGAIEMTEEPFSDFEFDGIMGLGLQGLSQMPEFNFPEIMSRAGGFEPIFAVFLATSDHEQSEITFGGINEEHVEEGHGMSWCDVQEAELGYWQIDVFGLKVDDQNIDYCKEGCRAIIDTGSSLLAVPSTLRMELWQLLMHKNIPSPEGDCIGPGPRLEIDLGNVTIQLGPQDYAKLDPTKPSVELDTTEGVDPSSHEQTPNSEQAEMKSTSCVPMLMNMDLPEPLKPRTLILGEPVLQKYYAAFDSRELRIGFAKAKHSSQPSQSGEGQILQEDDVIFQ